MYSNSIADYGAQRILHMDGSLMGYINTGNPNDKHYYKQMENDKFVSSNKTRRKFDVKTAIISGLSGLGIGLLLPKLNLKNLKKLFGK